MRDSYRRPENGLLFFEKNGSKSAPYLYKNCRGEYNQFCKEGNFFSKGNGFLLVKNMSFRGIIKGYFSKGNGFLLNKTTKNMQGNREMSFKRKRLPLERNSRIRCRIRGFFSKGNGFLLSKKQRKQARESRNIFQKETVSSW